MNIKKFLIYIIVGGIIMTIFRCIGPNSFSLGWIGGVLFYGSMQLIDKYFEDDKEG